MSASGPRCSTSYSTSTASMAPPSARNCRALSSAGVNVAGGRLCLALSKQYSTYAGYEDDAVELFIYETLVVDGLLQTEEYATAVVKASSARRQRVRDRQARPGPASTVNAD